jgi:threonine aldolase
MKHIRGFASDNNAGVHPDIMEAIIKANQGHAIAYGGDVCTQRAVAKFKEHFGPDVDVFFVFIGTAANVLGLRAATQSFNSIICANTAHINVDESTAPEKFTGCRLVPVQTPDGKLTVKLIQPHVHGFGFEHHAQPGVISITQSTEMGTLYTPDEIKDITSFAHDNNMLVHVDGARLANAAVSLGLSFKEITGDCGVDVLSFGGTKNGLMYGEAIIFFNRELSDNFKYIRKQGMQLASKMRFIAAQFEAYLSNNLWAKNALHSNKMATLLFQALKDIKEIKITQKVQANSVFAIVPKQLVPVLQEEYFFYTWDDEKSEVRWMTSFDTKEEDIEDFVKLIREKTEG